MKPMSRSRRGSLLALLLACAPLLSQDPPAPPPGRGFGPGGPMGEEKKLVKQHDRDRNGWLDRTERKAAREAVKAERARGDQGRGPGGRGGPFGPEDRE